jgi:Anti-sigma-K factor rskA
LEVNDIISSGLLELYVLGKTTAQETEQVLSWKALHPEVAAELLAIEDSLEQLDFAKAVTPSVNTKQQLFAAIKKENTNVTIADNTRVEQAIVKPISTTIAPVKNISNNYKYATAASVALLVGSLVFNMSTYSKYNKANDALAAAEKKIAASNDDLAAMQKQLEVPLNNAAQAVVLKSTDKLQPNNTAKIFWIKNTNEVYVEPSGLPEAPKGFQYQLWAIVDGKPVDAGMISLDKSKKYNIQKMKSFGKAQAFAITLEKEGGSPTPTMEKMFVMSNI